MRTTRRSPRCSVHSRSSPAKRATGASPQSLASLDGDRRVDCSVVGRAVCPLQVGLNKPAHVEGSAPGPGSAGPVGRPVAAWSLGRSADPAAVGPPDLVGTSLHHPEDVRRLHFAHRRTSRRHSQLSALRGSRTRARHPAAARGLGTRSSSWVADRVLVSSHTRADCSRVQTRRLSVPLSLPLYGAYRLPLHAGRQGADPRAGFESWRPHMLGHGARRSCTT